MLPSLAPNTLLCCMSPSTGPVLHYAGTQSGLLVSYFPDFGQQKCTGRVICTLTSMLGDIHTASR